MTPRKTAGRRRIKREPQNPTPPSPELTTPRRLLRRHEAAAYIEQTWGIPFSPGTLANLAVTGDGPAFYRTGRYPLYDTPDLDAYARRRLGPKIHSTSERATAAA
jgi:hypothetical protein